MIYSPTTKKAMAIMFECHKNQVDKADMPYPFHPFHVAESMPDEKSTCVALLHDVVEDTPMTLEDLRNAGFADDILFSLSNLTHLDGQDYYEYVANLSLDPTAILVKLSDLKHNSDLSRLDVIDEKVVKRIKKYDVCIRFLESQLQLIQYGKYDLAKNNAEKFIIENQEEKYKKI
ncbi:MAG: GTP pyrophosphokinase [Bacilli bacterium]|nr:GTP pyrophosphokinase [Bacilli bacterium]